MRLDLPTPKSPSSKTREMEGKGRITDYTELYTQLTLTTLQVSKHSKAAETVQYCIPSHRYTSFSSSSANVDEKRKLRTTIWH